uniref:ATP synthase subunit a n=1 Tax=Lissoclinum patella TaxID=13110 RepID=A0A059V9C5_9ASCI|nr:ATP synthase F0 subunit 6 [Lissoclinum patella]
MFFFFFFFFFLSFSFVVLMNFFSIFPYSYSLVWGFFTVLIAFLSFFYIMLLNMKKNMNIFLAHFLPIGTPPYLWVALVVIEFVSYSMRPLFLGMRLIINLSSGHVMLHIMGESFYTFFFFIIFMFLEISMCVIQSYVYVLLLFLYGKGM